MRGGDTPLGARLALGLLLVVGGVVVLDLVWSTEEHPEDIPERSDGGPLPTTADPSDPGEEEESRSGPSIEVVPGSPMVPPLDGFEGSWLVAGDPARGRFHLLPFDGGPVLELSTPAQLLHPNVGRGSVVTRGMLVTPAGGLSLHDGRWFPSNQADGGSGSELIGVTSSGSSLAVDGDRLVEWWTDDVRRREGHDSPVISSGQGEAVGVAGRQVIHQGPNGVFRLDLDSGEVVGLGLGEVWAVGSGEVLVRRCDGQLRCEELLVAVSDGSVLAALDPSIESAWVPVSTTEGHRFSPNGERLALVADGEVVIVDVASGRAIGRVDLPTRPSIEQPTIMWAPDSSAGLIVAPDYGEQTGVRDAPFVVWFDRSGSEMQPLDAWSASLDQAPRGSTWLLHLVDADLRVDLGGIER